MIDRRKVYGKQSEEQTSGCDDDEDEDETQEGGWRRLKEP